MGDRSDRDRSDRDRSDRDRSDRGGTPHLADGESETLLATGGRHGDAHADLSGNAHEHRPDPQDHHRHPGRQRPGGNHKHPPAWLSRFSESRRAPFLRLLLYYLIVGGVMVALVHLVPAVRNAFIAPVALPDLGPGPVVEDIGARLSLAEALRRAITTVLVIVGALALVVPVAWVYMFTKRFRYDPALVSSVIILPIVVAGIALVVKNSLALAFSLAGIVAAVRFRNTLKDPRDAVYIFLVIGIGLSAGVQALDVALAMSMLFNFVVLFVWKYNVGSIYGGRYGRTGIMSVGDSALLTAQDPSQQREVRRRLLSHEDDMKRDGILLVHSPDPDLARLTVQEALGDMARDWRLVDVVRHDGRPATLEYLVRLKRRATPADLVGALDERWSSQVAAAEYVPFRTRRKKRGKKRQDG